MKEVVVRRLRDIWCKVGIRTGCLWGNCVTLGLSCVFVSFLGDDKGCSDPGSGLCCVGDFGLGGEVASTRADRKAARVPQMIRVVVHVCWRTYERSSVGRQGERARGGGRDIACSESSIGGVL